MKNALGKWCLLVALMSLTACGTGDEATVAEETAAPVTTRVEAGGPEQPATTFCYYYTCPRTGRSYGGSTLYEAEHRCELNCGDYCTYAGNVCA